MEQISLLNQSYVAVMQLNGLYLIANVILLWMMFRGEVFFHEVEYYRLTF